MKTLIVRLTFLGGMLLCAGAGNEVPVSESTEACIECHQTLHPGIVADWRNSHHANTADADGKSVGCAECHTINPASHQDTFDHNDFQVHIVVTPPDCATCHAAEAEQYADNIMANAFGNLMNNPLYRDLMVQINGTPSFRDGKAGLEEPHALTDADACLACHGTIVKVTGTRTVETAVDEAEIPTLSGWPNQGVGRINPDGSKGACTACHTRHRFSIAEARKPATCGQCHKGPDVPAYPVYNVSKHGNIYDSSSELWNFYEEPWVVGEHFTAPTCATCHISELATPDGEIIVKRTHRMTDRLPWRLFGIYGHNHPKSPDTTIMKNKAGLPLPVELTGEPASAHLISEEEVATRLATMKKVCNACHGVEWVDGHFERLQHTIAASNKATQAATGVLVSAWDKGLAKGPAQNDSPFNEFIERLWAENWLFYANSIRIASAMSGADYGVFANGRWQQSKNLQQMLDWLKSHARD